MSADRATPTVPSRRRFLVLAAALISFACGPSYGVSESTFRVSQAASLPAPSGPALAGPPVAANHVGLEGSFSYDANNAGTATRAQGGGAQYGLDTRGAVRLLFNPGGAVEFGPSLEWSFGGLTPASPDLPPAEGFTFARFGLVMRVPFVRNRAWVVGTNLELLPMLVSSGRVIERTDTVTSYSSCPGLGGNCVPTATPQGTMTTDTTSVDQKLRGGITARVGLYGGGRIGSRVTLLAGMLLQTQPDVIGYQVLHSSCDTRGSGYADSTCNAPDIPAIRTAVVGTPWVSAGVDLGRVTVYAQGYFNVFGPASIIARSPAGLSLTTRVNF